MNLAGRVTVSLVTLAVCLAVAAAREQLGTVSVVGSAVLATNMYVALLAARPGATRRPKLVAGLFLALGIVFFAQAGLSAAGKAGLPLWILIPGGIGMMVGALAVFRSTSGGRSHPSV